MSSRTEPPPHGPATFLNAARRSAELEGLARGEVVDLLVIGGGVVATVRTLRTNELFLKIVEVDPELLVPYLLDRRGRTQDAILALVEAAVAEGQAEGSVRAGDPVLLARSVVLACHGFALSAQTMTDPSAGGPDEPALEDELRSLVDRYLRP